MQPEGLRNSSLLPVRTGGVASKLQHSNITFLAAEQNLHLPHNSQNTFVYAVR
jgi:hypothetical protein